MPQQIAHVALVVRDYDEAIEFFTKKLDFDLIEDTHQPAQKKRWVLVAPPNSTGTSVLLAEATSEEQRATIGKQAGGRVFLFLYTDDFWQDYERMLSRSVTFVRDPRVEAYGTVAVFEDVSGNHWDLLQPTNASTNGL